MKLGMKINKISGKISYFNDNKDFNPIKINLKDGYYEVDYGSWDKEKYIKDFFGFRLVIKNDNHVFLKYVDKSDNIEDLLTEGDYFVIEFNNLYNKISEDNDYYKWEISDMEEDGFVKFDKERPDKLYQGVMYGINIIKDELDKLFKETHLSINYKNLKPVLHYTSYIYLNLIRRLLLCNDINIDSTNFILFII